MDSRRPEAPPRGAEAAPASTAPTPAEETPRAKKLSAKEWVNFALVRCPDCYSTQIASCTRQRSDDDDDENGPSLLGAKAAPRSSAEEVDDEIKDSSQKVDVVASAPSYVSKSTVAGSGDNSSCAVRRAAATEVASTASQEMKSNKRSGVSSQLDGEQHKPESGLLECGSISLHCVPVLDQVVATSGTLSYNLQCPIVGCDCAATDHARRGLNPLRCSTAAGHEQLPSPYGYCLTCSSAVSKAEIASRPPFAWSRVRPSPGLSPSLFSRDVFPVGSREEAPGQSSPYAPAKARNGSSSTLKVEAFRVTVEEVLYLVKAWNEAALPDTITHSMMYCPCCRAVGFPGSEDHLTIFQGSKDGKELVYTNPSALAMGKVGRVNHWRLDHTPHCTEAGRERRRSRSGLGSRTELTRIRYDQGDELVFEGDEEGASRIGRHGAPSINKTEVGGPCLLPIRLSRREAVRFKELVKFHAVSVAGAARLAPSKSAARYRRIQQIVRNLWRCGLRQLEHARGETQLIQAFGDLRRLVVAEGAEKFLRKDDMNMLLQLARKIRDRGRQDVQVESTEQKSSVHDGKRRRNVVTECESNDEIDEERRGIGSSGESKIGKSFGSLAAEGSEYTMAVASALGWLLRALKPDSPHHRLSPPRDIMGYYAAGSLVSGPPSLRRLSRAPSSPSSESAPPSSSSMAPWVFGPPMPPPSLTRTSTHPPQQRHTPYELSAMAALDEVEQFQDLHRHGRILNNLANARRLRSQLQQHLGQQVNW